MAGENRVCNVGGFVEKDVSKIEKDINSSNKLEEARQASQPLKRVARATRFTPRVKAPIRRLQLCVWHMPFMLWKAWVMYLRSSLFTLSSSHMNP